MLFYKTRIISEGMKFVMEGRASFDRQNFCSPNPLVHFLKTKMALSRRNHSSGLDYVQSLLCNLGFVAFQGVCTRLNVLKQVPQFSVIIDSGLIRIWANIILSQIGPPSVAALNESSRKRYKLDDIYRAPQNEHPLVLNGHPFRLLGHPFRLFENSSLCSYLVFA